MFYQIKKHKKTYFIVFLAAILLLVSSSYWANRIIITKSKDFITDDINKVKPVKVALLLGTSKYLKNGKPNAYFFNRIDATVTLFKQQKINYLIISGDNSRSNYNEPLDMMLELARQGVDTTKVYLDYAGFRTYDSVIRAKEIFGQDTLIFVSQAFHNQRAIYIAQQNGMLAYGFNAKDVTAFSGFRTKIRELFARNKVFIDQWINTKPKFLGEKIIIP
jgi:SanA protein